LFCILGKTKGGCIFGRKAAGPGFTSERLCPGGKKIEEFEGSVRMASCATGFKPKLSDFWLDLH
jgi:hypothetical protein